MLKNKINQFPSKVILWGGTGQAKLVRPIIEYYGSKIIAVFDDTVGLKSPFKDISIYYGWQEFKKWLKGKKREEIGFCVAVGNPHGRVRINFHQLLKKEGLKPISLMHSTAYISDNAVIGEGAQILAGAIIAPEVRIGKQCIINANASIDHECVLKDGVEIGPGATLCGRVKLDVNVWIGAGATILPRIAIGADSIVGAGAVVTKDLSPGMIVAGVPAKPLVKKHKK